MSTFPNWSGRHSVRRRLIQLAFLACFIVMPLFDLCRFDFEAGRLHLFGAEIWLDEWALLWLALMFGMWLIGALSLLFGRVYCAYACPQMLFSEIAHDFDALGKRIAKPLKGKWRPRVANVVSYTLLGLMSLAASVLCMAYFAPMSVVLARVSRLDVGLWVGLLGALVMLFTFLDFAFVREEFCRSACPYGLLQGVIEDGRSLHVEFDPSIGECIECKACVRVCPMHIDIRDGAYQIECTRCGTCIDACDTVLARLKTPRQGLLAFRMPTFSLATLDIKRVLVSVATIGFGVAFALAVGMRSQVAFVLSPVYTAGEQSSTSVEARFLLRASNRGRDAVSIAVRPEGLPDSAEIVGIDDPVVPAGTEKRFQITVRLPLAATESSVTPFVLVVEGGGESKEFAAALLAHGRRSTS